MGRSLNLIKNDQHYQEKRTFPRFPFCFLTFRSSNAHGDKVFEVRDISQGGMQLGLRDGEHNLKVGTHLEGIIHWSGRSLQCRGNISWVSPQRLGVIFDFNKSEQEELTNLLSLKNVVSEIKALHRPFFGLELPPNLKVWLRADGPIELFLWQHSDKEISRFQIILFKVFVEWLDGEGLKTGVVHSNRQIDTPLDFEDEFTFLFDGEIDGQKQAAAIELINNCGNDLIDEPYKEFILLRLKLLAP